MLQFIQYSSTSQIFEQVQDVFENIDDLLVVTPSPAKADEARLRFDSVSKAIESITISKFMKEQIMILLPEDSLENYKGKSELLLFLGAIWKKLHQGQNYKSFVHAFSLFTELRSFTVETPVIEEVLEYYESEVAKTALVFQQLMVQMEIIDEHGSYNLLTQKLRDGDLPIEYPRERKILFYGFDSLTSSQVDMLKALGIRDEVYILQYKYVLENASALDWTHWLSDEVAKDLSCSSDKQKETPVFHFPRNYLFQALSELPRKEVIVLGTKRNDMNYIQELPFSDYCYKQSVDLFSQAYEQLWFELDPLPDNAESLRKKLKSLIDIYIKKENFRGVKSALCLLNQLNEWGSLSDMNSSLGFFDFELLKESTSLNLPRTNKTLLSSQFKGEIHTLASMDQLSNKDIYLVISSNYQKLSFGEGNYTDKVEKYLASIGPIRRAEFEFNIYLSKINELLQKNNVTFIIEDHFLESDVYWKRILDHFNLKTQTIEFNFEQDKKYLVKAKTVLPIEKISSSRLQTYSDCPQKYYYTYVEKLAPQVKLRNQFDAMELGLMQHKVIELYIEKESEFKAEKLLEVIDFVLLKYSKDKHLDSSRAAVIEIQAYTQTIIKYLLKIKTDFGMTFEIEKPFRYGEDLIFNGSIDCWAINSEFTFVLDFKRSGAVFDTYQRIESFEKNQLWFYLKRLQDLNLLASEKKILFGYVDLSNVSNSMIFTDDQKMGEYWKTILEVQRVKVISDLPERMESYSQFEHEEITRLQSEKKFAPSPVNEKVCGFCFLNAVCSREAVSEES